MQYFIDIASGGSIDGIIEGMVSAPNACGGGLIERIEKSEEVALHIAA
jgi:hypothetical protein